MQATLTTRVSLALRAILALVLMVGFYALAFAVAGAFLLLLCFQWRNFDRSHTLLGLGLTLACLGIAGVILWSLLPRFRDDFRGAGVPLDPEDHPRLFEELESISGAVGQAMPEEVFLDPDVNAWVSQRGRHARPRRAAG